MSAEVIQQSAEVQRLFVKLAEDLEEGRVLSVTELAGNLEHPEPSIRRLSVLLLEITDDAKAVPALLRAAADADHETGIAAAEALRGFNNLPGAIPYLVSGLESPHPEARLATLVALREARAEAAVGSLVRVLQDPDAIIRREAILALSYYRREELIPAIRELSRDEDELVRRTVLEALAQFDEPQVVDSLVAAIQDASWQVRQTAARLLSRFPREDSERVLRQALRDPAWQVVKEALISLGNLQVKADEEFLNLLKSDIADIRVAAATALGLSGSYYLLSDLRRLITDPDTGVQKAALRAIQQLSLSSPINQNT